MATDNRNRIIRPAQLAAKILGDATKGLTIRDIWVYDSPFSQGNLVDPNDLRDPPPGGSGGGGGISKSDDAPQVKALREMLGTSFAAARDTRLGNVDRIQGQQDAELLLGYGERRRTLEDVEKDNERAEADTSFANWMNRARERSDLLAEAAVQGAGESDNLRAQLMALRNWDANQGEINRAYYDTARSIQNTVSDLNTDTRQARFSLFNQGNNDREQIWNSYYAQMADGYTQLGGIQANPYSNQHKKNADSFGKAATEAAKSWTNPGVSSEVREWTGEAADAGDRLNNTQFAGARTNLAERKPEGATLRRWN